MKASKSLSNFRKNLSWLLQTRRGSASELASAAAVTKSFLTRLQKPSDAKDSQVPTLEVCSRISDCLCISLGDFTDLSPTAFRAKFGKGLADEDLFAKTKLRAAKVRKSDDPSNHHPFDEYFVYLDGQEVASLAPDEEGGVELRLSERFAYYVEILETLFRKDMLSHQ